MNLQSLVAAILISFCFAGWPVVSKYSGASGVWVASVVTIGGALATLTLCVFGKQMVVFQLPSIRAIIILIVAGALNGAAFYFYSMKVADPKIPTAVFITIVAILMVVVAPLLDWALNGVIPNLQKTFGYMFAALAIYLLIK